MHRIVATLRPFFILIFMLAFGHVLYENFKPPDYEITIVSPINGFGLSPDAKIATEEFAIASEITSSSTPSPTQKLTQTVIPTTPFVLSNSVTKVTPTIITKPSATKTPVPSQTPTPSLIPTAKPSVTASPKLTLTPIQPPTATLASPPGSEEIWTKLAKCESGGNWSIDTGNGYFGGLQFSQGAWNSVGGSGNPAHASREEQIAKGKLLQQKRGWGVWGLCAKNLGLN